MLERLIKSKKIFAKIANLKVVFLLLVFLLYNGYSSLPVIATYGNEDELGFEQLQEINPNVFGWINVYGTNIDYPLLQGDDNHRYTYTNARGEPAMSGAIFLDFRNNQDFTDFNSIVYGHDMARSVMFGDISNFNQADYFESRQYGMIFTGEEYYGLEIFAFMLVDAHDFEIYYPTMVNTSDKELLLQRVFAEAIHLRDVDVTTNDRIVILSTCTPTATNGRHILVARLMDEVPEDVFDGSPTGHDEGDGLFRVFGLDVSPLGLATGSFFVIGVTVATTMLIAMKKKKKLATPLTVEEELEAELVKELAKKKRPLSWLEEIFFMFGKVAIIVVIVGVLFTFIFGATQVNDAAMSPNMQEGDIVFFQRVTNNFIEEDTIVVRYSGQTQVRRVVAVSGDTVDITDQGLIVNDLLKQELHIFEETTQFVEGITFPLVVPEGELFVLGDSRARARDSRIYGTVRTRDVLGSVVTVIRRRNL